MSPIKVAPAGELSEVNRSSVAVDLVIAAVLIIAGAALSWYCSHRLSYGLRGATAENVWFESDVNRVYANIVSRYSDHFRSKVHPIFALIAIPVSYAFEKSRIFDLDNSANAYLAVVAGAWAGLLYILLRRLQFDRVMSILGVVTALVTSSSLLFFSVPETYGTASVSIVAALLIVLISQGTRWERVGAIAASAVSLSITVTNWMLGLLLTLRGRRMSQWIQLSINAFFAVTLLWSAEKMMAKTAEFFTTVSEESHYTVHVTPARILRVADAFLFHSAIAHAVEQTRDFGVHADVGPDWRLGLSFQNAWPGSGSPWGVAAAMLWGIALALGAWTIVRSPESPILRILLVFLALQFMLHTVYGIETFMYALDWLPVLLIVAMIGFRQFGRFRWPAVALLIGLLSVNNFQQFQTISGILAENQRIIPISHPTDRAQIPMGCDCH